MSKEYHNLYKGTDFAIQILISTLQKCIEEDIIDIEFSYSIIKKTF
ncbi:MAG: hypothetical protein M1480_04525 [Bacteroidetes bacterium]|nr:hypothetical protein [Bacteroidota bacterium]